MADNTYRGYLQGLATGGDKTANALLQVVGDDFGIDQNFLSSGSNIGQGDLRLSQPGVIAANEQYGNQYRSLNSPRTLGVNTNLSNGGGGGTIDPLGVQKTSFLNQLPGALSNVRQTGNEAFGGLYSNLQGGAQDLVNTIRTGQRNINQGRETNELNRRNAMTDILGYVRNGIRSGGSQLASMNATDSSGGDAILRAYSTIGNQRARGVGNQAALQGRQLDTAQEDLNLQNNQGQTNFHRIRDQAVQSIGSDIRQRLAELDQTGQGLGLNGRVAIDQEKQQLINSGMQRLQEVDQWLQSQLGGIAPESQDQIIGNALQMGQAGTQTANPFDIGQFGSQQINGPAVDQLPLFTRARRRE